MPQPAPKSLGDAIGRLLRRRGLVDRSAVAELDQVWKQVVGLPCGNHSRLRKIRGGVAEVVVSNSAVLEELRGFLHQQVLEQLQQRLPQSSIRSIRYVRERL